MERELDHLNQALSNPKQPVIGVVGGAKISTKIDVLNNLVKKLDVLIIGGGMANGFFAANGHDIGISLSEDGMAQVARQVMENAVRENCRILLPTDVVVAKKFEAHAPSRVVEVEHVAADEMILDAGPKSVDAFADAVHDARTLIWNGPLGAFELSPFDTATMELMKYTAKRVKSGDLIAVSGGGDTVSALKQAGVKDNFTFVSTAGGAFLEWMEGKTLPGVAVLQN
jgi:phosphoglycerate kinase